MRDSRVGAFGAIALTLALVTRIAAIAALADGGVGRAAAALILVGAASRLGALVPLTALAPARGDGLGASAGRLATAAFLGAAAATAGSPSSPASPALASAGRCSPARSRSPPLAASPRWPSVALAARPATSPAQRSRRPKSPPWSGFSSAQVSPKSRALAPARPPPPFSEIATPHDPRRTPRASRRSVSGPVRRPGGDAASGARPRELRAAPLSPSRWSSGWRWLARDGLGRGSVARAQRRGGLGGDHSRPDGRLRLSLRSDGIHPALDGRAVSQRATNRRASAR